jgi:alpha-tubulin suppressor-like RCC1 family protein
MSVVPLPVQVGADHDWSGIAAGTFFSFGLKTNGTLFGWGGNSFSVLGVGSLGSSFEPRPVPGSNWIAVSAGNDHTIALQSDGSLWIWGEHLFTNGSHFYTNLPMQVGSDTDWQTISAGRQHSLALKLDGSLWSWGINTRGELGTGVSSTPLPLRIGSLLWTDISAGYYNSLGVQTDGSLWFWGQSIPGGTPTPAPFRADGGTSFNWKMAANATMHSVSAHALALKRSGTLWGWGSNSRGQLENVTSMSGLPVQISTETNWSRISIGDQFSAALRTDGTICMTGFNFYGQLGLNSRNDTNSFTQLGTETNWKTVAAGYRHVLAIKSNGSLWAWGDNSYGQCAQPALFEPTPVPGSDWGSPRK